MSDSGDTCITRVPIFSNLDTEQQLEVARFARPIHAEAGERVMTAGSPERRLLVVHTGRVRVVHLLANGREHVVRVLGEGDVIGEDAFVLGRRPTHHAYADTDTELCTFDHSDLAKVVAKFPKVAVRMLQVQSERLANAERMLAAMGGADVSARLASYLLDLPSKNVPDGVGVELPMAKKDVASHLGTSPETLSRRLRDWADAGILETRGRRELIIRDVDALIAQASAVS